jgi:uncharacterized membrane protein
LIKRENKNNNLVKTSFISLLSVARSVGIKKNKNEQEKTQIIFFFFFFTMKHKMGMNNDTFLKSSESEK